MTGDADIGQFIENFDDMQPCQDALDEVSPAHVVVLT